MLLEMTLNFRGKPEEFKAKLLAGGVIGDWSESNGNHVFRDADGGILNWAPTTSTIWFQGPSHAKHSLEERVSRVLGNPSTSSGPGSPTGTDAQEKARIFVVHGHDTIARDQLELALRRLGLEPFVLMYSSGDGDTIIEALEKRIGKKYTTDFGIVLFTPDDMGHAKDSPADIKPRPRQNVVLEAGMLVASMTRARVAFILKGHLEMPSDLNGVIYANFNDHVREAMPKVISRMQGAGISIDPTKIPLATTA
jgi:predicted nucleotide-binding protein